MVNRNKSIRIQFSAIAIILLSLLASVLQFHNHDCLGHIEMDMAFTDITIGCNHHNHAHYGADSHHDNAVSTKHGHQHHHNDKGDDCAMHISLADRIQSPCDLTGHFNNDNYTVLSAAIKTDSAPVEAITKQTDIQWLVPIKQTIWTNRCDNSLRGSPKA